MSNLLPPIPEHLSTLGLLDGQIGFATLGYIVGPDVVPRFPSKATVYSDKLVGIVSDQGDLIAQLESINWAGAIESPIDYNGLIQGAAWRAIVSGDDLSVLFEEEKLYQGEMSEIADSQVEIVEREEMQAEVLEIDGEADIMDCDQVASVTAKPGQGRCK